MRVRRQRDRDREMGRLSGRRPRRLPRFFGRAGGLSLDVLIWEGNVVYVKYQNELSTSARLYDDGDHCNWLSEEDKASPTETLHRHCTRKKRGSIFTS